MKRTSEGANKESFGHQSIATAWARDDGKPKPIPENATEDATEEWAANMTKWALKGGRRSVDLPLLNDKKASLQKKRIETSMEYARIRRQVQSEKDAIIQAKKVIDGHLVTLSACRERMYKLIEKGDKMLAQRRKIDKQGEELSKQITLLEAENEE